MAQLVVRGRDWWLLTVNCTAQPLLGVSVVRSHDNGRHWERPTTFSSISCSVPVGARLTMVDSHQGVVDQYMAEGVSRFTTVDGGATWRPVADIAGDHPLRAYLPSGLGVATSALPFDGPNLWLTHDRGTRWSRVGLESRVREVGDVAAREDRLLFTATAEDGRTYVYTSRDGQRWRRSAPAPSRGHGAVVTVVTGRVWWTLDGRTTDGGRTWTQILRTGCATAPTLPIVYAGSSRLAAVPIAQTQHAALCVTHDGGAHWRIEQFD